MMLDAQYKKNCKEKKPESSLLVSLGKALNRMLLLLFGRQQVEPNSSWVPSLTKKLTVGARAHS